MTSALLYPSDPLTPRRVDRHFGAEAAEARELGAGIILLDHDALLRGDTAEAIRRVPAGAGPLWYRGWMIPAGRYADLAAALAGRGAALAVPPGRYRRAHELPGWYPVFEPVTPASVWTPLPDPARPPAPADLAALAAPLGGGPGVVKDYVKSRKSDWDTACFVPDLADSAGLHRIVARFTELQGDDLAGGIVLRAYETFSTAGRAAEARVWWLDGAPIAVGPHPDTPEEHPEPDLAAVGPLVAALDCRFVTTDLARRADGAWRVVEVGDGQVSDRPATLEPARLLAPLLRAGHPAR
ncbi:ATP-grasp domain-containing protein [Marinactinospora rubrisoli]|uniref:ATP-grasp domain-containing protein n=1 Tax=Marinactinospora rubrisoli TaxID=2715399 RepID=A0ABW2KMA1_9ACTN